jgi:hypothetical protein
MSPIYTSVIPPHPIALGRHASACRIGTEADRLAARQVLAAARIKDVALKQMDGTPPLSREQITELNRVFRGEVSS